MKFIHLADVHLGAVPERGTALGEKRGEEIWESFRRVITEIRNNPVDFLFIAGDLFHRKPLLRELREVNYLFSKIPETQIFLMAGNHDYLTRDSFYLRFPWEKNVTFFEKEEIQCVKAVGKDVYVYGNSYENQEIKEAIYQKVRPGKEEGYHILMAHGGDAEHVPMDYQSLSAAGFHYTALGHIHKPQILFTNQMAYPGSLEPLDRNETGVHGYVEGTLENGQVQIRFVPFACRFYEKLVLNVREDMAQYDLEDQAKELIGKHGNNNIYQIILRGKRSPDMLFLPERFAELGNVIEVRDESRPAYQLGELERQYSGTLVGSYIAYFREKENLTEVEEKALYYGLQALLETTNNGYQTLGNPKLRKNT